MKFSTIFATFSGAASQDVRGIKPPGRLEKTQNNFKLWLSQNIVDQAAVQRWSDRVDKMAANMLSAYGRANCGFYDSSLTNGGPDPNPDLRPNGKPRKTFERKRREVEDEDLRFDETNPLKGLTQITNNSESGPSDTSTNAAVSDDSTTSLDEWTNLSASSELDGKIKPKLN